MNDVIEVIGDAAPIVAICLFALPAYVGILRQRGFWPGLAIILILGLYAIGFETLAVKTGLPYGRFSYSDSLGHKLFGAAPWTVGLVYGPLLLAAFWAASKLSMKRGRVILTGIFMALIGLVLSPATAKLGLFEWETSGQFYGVPALSFAGLLLSGLLGGWLLLRLWGKERPVKASIAYSGLAMALFWTGVNIGVEQWVPVGTGTLVSLVLLVVLIIEKRRLKREKHGT